MRPRRLTKSVVRLGTAAQNALEVARFGGLRTGDEPSPFDVVGRTPVYRLRRYFPERGGPAVETGRPPLLLVPPLMLTAEVYDVAPHVSGVAALDEAGIDPWVVDFGAPEHEEGGLERTLADHVLAVSDAVDRVRQVVGADVHLGGYSQGGMFGYQTTAYRRGEGIRSLTTFGSPVDVHQLSPAGIPLGGIAEQLAVVADAVLGRAYVPAGLSRRAFQMIDPLKTVRSRLSFLSQLHDRESLLEREGSRRFLEQNGWVAWPGPAVAEFASQFLAHNRMLSGGFVINGRLVTLADIEVPTLAVVGSKDEIAAAPAVRAIRRAAPAADIYELTLAAGHMGLVVGGGARRNSWPVVAEWVRWHEGLAEQPEQIAPLTEDHEDTGSGTGVVEVATELLVSAAGVAVDTAVDAAKRVQGVVDEALDQLPRLARLERASGDSRTSLGLLRQQQAERSGDDTFFLFEGRAYSYRDANARIEAVTRGLIDVGVRHGDRVGVLMRTRPTALASVVALSRLGAVAVLLRGGEELAREVRLGRVTRILSDPDHAEEAARVAPGPLLVLGAAGAAGRRVPEGAIDMEAIDHTAVALPGWYRPNPSRARDTAMVLFTGEGDATRAYPISNRRWALSAYGTATAASLGRGDTVYAVSPIYHPATILTAVGGALVSRARLAVSPEFTPGRFWEEVRRYGVTVVSYTWAMCLPLVTAPRSAAEQHHPIRLFMGSGMPRGVWERVLDRFRPAQVLEFYASSNGDLVLANVRGGKPGSMGRPLPGTAAVELAAFDPASGRLVIGDDGFVRRAAEGELGMLLVELAPSAAPTGRQVSRGAFEPDDAWAHTGDLFRRDADGDLWFAGAASALIERSGTHISPVEVEAALESIDPVELAAVYPLDAPAGEDRPGARLVIAALQLRDEDSLDRKALITALGALPERAWPDVVIRVEAFELTSHHRIRRRSLAAHGLGPRPEGWWRSPRTGTYEAIDDEARDRLAGSARTGSSVPA